MTSTPDLEALRFLMVECEGMRVVIGDPKQIGAIGPGGLYGLLTRIIEPATLTTIHRQRRMEDREFVALVHEGRGSGALDLLRTRGRLVVGDDLPSTLNAMLADWHRDFTIGADAVMIARRNRDVDDLNYQARKLRRKAGALGDAEVIVGEHAFASGDRVPRMTCRTYAMRSSTKATTSPLSKSDYGRGPTLSAQKSLAVAGWSWSPQLAQLTHK